jgi:disulfide bond formation protein DsbB
MTVDTVTLFFALLSGLSVLIAAAVALSAVTADKLGVLAALRPVSVEVAAAIAVTATAGSLYLSEVQGYDPCRLCWIQRGFMYPAAIVLVIAVLTRFRPAILLAAALAAIGLAVALFHRYEQASGEVGGFCDQANPCSSRWVEQFGFVTIPTMAAAGFVAILALCLVAANDRKEDRI